MAHLTRNHGWLCLAIGALLTTAACDGEVFEENAPAGQVQESEGPEVNSTSEAMKQQAYVNPAEARAVRGEAKGTSGGPGVTKLSCGGCWLKMASSAICTIECAVTFGFGCLLCAAQDAALYDCVVYLKDHCL